jgi:hypothetical protein
MHQNSNPQNDIGIVTLVDKETGYHDKIGISKMLYSMFASGTGYRSIA